MVAVAVTRKRSILFSMPVLVFVRVFVVLFVLVLVLVLMGFGL